MSEEKSFSASSYWFQQSLKAHIDRDIAKRNKAMDETELQQSKKPANNKRPTFEDYCFEQIKLMEPENRLAFLDINQGESDFYEIGKKWLRDYNLATGKKKYNIRAFCKQCKKPIQSMGK